jgi:hypothetical protein
MTHTNQAIEMIDPPVTIELSALRHVQGGDFAEQFDRAYNAGRRVVRQVSRRLPYVGYLGAAYQFISSMPGQPFTGARRPGDPIPPNDSSFIGAP